MAQHQFAPPVTTSTIEERNRTFKRVVLRIVPFATLIYIVAWVDRANVGFAKLTMLDDLSWSEAIYGAGAGIFFLGYFFFEVPSNLLLQKIGAPKTIMRIGIGWGAATLLMAFVTEPWHFYGLRFLQGAFEAGLHPGLILYLTYWLPAHRRAKALAIFMSASPIALVVGSPVAGTIMGNTDGLFGTADWQWLFIIEAIPAIILGALAVLLMTDRPKNAKWLSRQEKDHVAYELAVEDASLSGRQHKLSAALRTPTMWFLILALFCIITANATLSFYGPSLVAAVITVDIETLGWIMSGVFVFGWIGMLVNGWLSDRHGEARWHAACAVALGAIGLISAGLSLQAGSGLGVILSLALSAAGTMGSIPVFWSLPSRFLSGTALAAGVALINSIANLAGYFSPQFLGIMKTNTGSYSTGLFTIASVELLAAVILILFIKRNPASSPTLPSEAANASRVAEVAPHSAEQFDQTATKENENNDHHK